MSGYTGATCEPIPVVTGTSKRILALEDDGTIQDIVATGTSASRTNSITNVGAGISHLLLNLPQNRAYASYHDGRSASGIVVIDTTTDTVVARIPRVGSSSLYTPVSMAINPSGTRLSVLQSDTGYDSSVDYRTHVYTFDTSTNQLVGAGVDIGSSKNINVDGDLMVSRDGRYVYILNAPPSAAHATVIVVDTTTNTSHAITTHAIPRYGAISSTLSSDGHIYIA